MKLCIDCKHCKIEEKRLNDKINEIDHICTYQKSKNPITGEVTIHNTTCSTARGTSRLCGRDGDNFSRVKRENGAPWWRPWFRN